jgi:large subunit ribosomal protein L9
VPQAILLQDVETLGEKGTVIDVSPGYLRNYLLPRKLAEPATNASVQAAQRRRDEAERALHEAEDRARENAALLGRTVLTIPQQAGDDGRLFGSVTTQDIADAIRDARGIKLDRRKIHLEEPIRHTGTYMVVVEVTDEVTAAVKTMVVAADK